MAIIPADPHDALQHFCKSCICMQGKMWKNLNTSELFPVTSFSRLLLQFCLLERSSEVRKAWQWPVDHFWPTQMWVDLVSRSIFSYGKTLNNAESETRGVFVYFWLSMASFHKWVAWVANTNSASHRYQSSDLQQSFEMCRKNERAQNALRSLRW